MNGPIVFLDIETREPSSETIRDYITSTAKPRANLKDPEKIAVSLEDSRAALLHDSPLSPLWGHVAVIAWQAEGSPSWLCSPNEREVLDAFNENMGQLWLENNKRMIRFCGFNISQFDLRFLWTRMIINGIRPLVDYQHDAKPWSDKVLDLRMMLSGGDKYAKGTLQDWIVAFGGKPREDDIAGDQISQAFAEGRHDEVVSHCLRDVEDCVWLYQRLHP